MQKLPNKFHYITKRFNDATKSPSNVNNSRTFNPKTEILHFPCIQKPRSLIPHHLQHACRNRMQFFLSFFGQRSESIHNDISSRGCALHWVLHTPWNAQRTRRNEGWIFYAKNYFNSFTEILRDVEWKARVFVLHSG